MSTDFLYTRSKQDNKLDFSAFSQQKRAQGNDLLRRKQFELAIGGNVSMLIWLGKNRLSQSDKQELKTQTSPPDSKNRLELIFLHAKRIVEAARLRPAGLTFDPENPEHRQALKDSIARSIEVQTDLYPEYENAFDNWEEDYEKVKEAVWDGRLSPYSS